MEGIIQALQCPVEIIATFASSTQDFLQKLTQILSQKSEKASKSFKKIAPKYQRMLLMASSEKALKRATRKIIVMRKNLQNHSVQRQKVVQE